MKPWHYARIKFVTEHPHHGKMEPHQAPAGNWVFFWIRYLHDARKTPFRETFQTMHTIGLDGVE